MMNKAKIIVLLFLAGMYNSPIFCQTGSDVQWDLDDIICKEQERAEASISMRGFSNPFAGQTDIYYESISWSIDPSQRYIAGEITYYFKSKVQDLTLLHLDLNKAMQINAIQRDGDPLSYTHGDDNLLVINLGETLQPGETDHLTIAYEGVPPTSGFGSFEQGEHAGQPILWTLSEPYGASDWWPCKQDLIDKIDSLDIFITTPPGQLAASNGKLIAIAEVDGKLIHHWQHRYPIVTYLVALAVTNYASYSHYLPLDNGETLEILNYVYPETMVQSQQETESALDILGLYNELFGIYPFADEKYGYAQFGWGGGQEHQTMSFMGNFSFGLQAHETAHQWFGDKVTCGSWTDIWLNEGFATYLTGLTLERFSYEEYWPLWKSSTSNSATSQPGGSVFVDDTTSVSRIFDGSLSYNKGAYLLHMLRWIIGDTLFFQACNNYLDGPETAYGFGRTEAFQMILENRSGKDLNEFFADWFYGQGYPSYSLNWSHQSDSLILWLNQEQSHPSVSFFEMPVPVYVSLNGTDTTFVLAHTYEGQRFSFYIGDTDVDSIKIDPEQWILSRNNFISEVTAVPYKPISDHSYLVYPNPAKDFISILPPDEVKILDIMDMYGQTSSRHIINNRIEIADFTPGYYYLVLKDKSGETLALQPLIILK